jgi:hypothetical protein
MENYEDEKTPPRAAAPSGAKRIRARRLIAEAAAGDKRPLWLEFPFGTGQVLVEEIPAKREERYYQPHWAGICFKGTQKADAERYAHLTRCKIEFLDATDLEPAIYDGFAYPRVHLDHVRLFRDREGQFFLTSEPYGSDKPFEQDQEWCRHNGWGMFVMPPGYGFHNPGYDGPGTRLILLSPPEGAPLDPIVATAFRVLRPLPRELQQYRQQQKAAPVWSGQIFSS